MDSDGTVAVRPAAPVAFGRGLFTRTGGGRFGDKSRRGGGLTNDNSSTTVLLISSADETERNVAKKYGRRGQGPVGRWTEGGGEVKIPATFFFSDLFICSVYLIRRSRTGAVRRRVVNRTYELAEDTVAWR